MRRARPPLPFALGAVCFGLLGFLEGPLGDARPAPPELRAALSLVVTSGADSGPGTLRDAILAADRSPERVRIDVLVPRVRLESALPPLVGPLGVAIDAPGRDSVIDGSAVGSGALLEIASPNSVVRGLDVRGAVDRGISIRAAGVELRDVELQDCSVGVLVGEGGDAARIGGSRFVRNGTGVLVDPRVSGVVVADNAFRGHDQAAIWSVSAAPIVLGDRRPLVIERNRFEDDRIGVVLLNVAGQVEANHLLRSVEIGILLGGGSVLRLNRIEGGNALGIVADSPAGALLEGNEVSGVGGVGILIRDARQTELRSNQVYSNAYGIAVVFGEPGPSALLVENLVIDQRQDGVVVLGGAPLLRRNRILRNQGAGLRLLDHVPIDGPRRGADPRLDANVVEANGSDEPMRGEYRERREQP